MKKKPSYAIYKRLANDVADIKGIEYPYYDGVYTYTLRDIVGMLRRCPYLVVREGKRWILNNKYNYLLKG